MTMTSATLPYLVCTSFSLLLLFPNPWESVGFKLDLFPSKGVNSCTSNNTKSLGPSASALRTGPCCATTMGPVHGSPSYLKKICSIRDILKDEGHSAASGLQVIMDFDLTITSPGSEQCHHMFETSVALSSHLRETLKPYIRGHVEVSSPQEWWERFHGILVGAKISREQVASVAKGADVSLREGTAEFLLLLQDLRVPLLIVSAGISDVIAEILRARELLLSNITIFANTMEFDEDGRLRRFKESPPVHSREESSTGTTTSFTTQTDILGREWMDYSMRGNFPWRVIRESCRNKNQAAERMKEYFAAHPERQCVIVVGDKPGDAGVNHGIAPDERCLKMGFFDHSDKYPHTDLKPLDPPQSESEIHGAGRAASLAQVFRIPCTLPDIVEGCEHMNGGVGDGSAKTSSSRLPVEIASVLASLRSDHESSLTDSTPGDLGNRGCEVSVEELERRRRRLLDQTLEVERMKNLYRDRFDVVAYGGYSMELVAEAVRYLTGQIDEESIHSLFQDHEFPR